jgi:hypothetical protein
MVLSKNCLKPIQTGPNGGFESPGADSSLKMVSFALIVAKDSQNWGEGGGQASLLCHKVLV